MANNDTARPFLPNIPINLSQDLQNILFAFKERIEELRQDPDTPGQPTGFANTAVAAGNKLQWNPVLKAHKYKLYRGETNSFTAARLIAVLAHRDLGYYFDVAGQTTATPLYYWIRAENAAGKEGPLSVMLTV